MEKSWCADSMVGLKALISLLVLSVSKPDILEVFQHQDDHTAALKTSLLKRHSLLACVTYSTVSLHFLTQASTVWIAVLQALLYCHVSETAVFIPAEELSLYSSIYCWPLLRLTSVLLFLIIMLEAVGSVSHSFL